MHTAEFNREGQFDVPQSSNQLGKIYGHKRFYLQLLHFLKKCYFNFFLLKKKRVEM